MNKSFIEINKKTGFFDKNSFMILTGFVIAALIIRLFYTNLEIPLALDALEYFVYAVDTSRLGHLPQLYSPSHNGWSIFLAMIFPVFQFDNGLNYMQLQKIISIIFSSITIIPIYFLTKQFFEKKYAILSVIIFVFEPRIIINSSLGIADPLYTFLISVSLVVVFNKRFALVSFGIAAIATMVRPEGLFLFIGIFIMYSIKYRNDRKIIPKIILAVFIFILILSPMMIYKNGIYGDDRIFGRVSETIEFHSKPIEETNGNSGMPFILTGLENFPKYLGWSMIPLFIVFVPLGMIIIFKEWKKINSMIIIPIITMSIPLFYVYAIPLLETRYIYFLFPLFCVISIFTIKKIIEKTKFQNIVMILIFSSIIIAGLSFSEYKKIDYDSQEYGFLVSEFLHNSAKGVNNFGYDRFVKSAQVLNEWPTLPKMYLDGHIISNISKIPIEDSKSIRNYIIESKENNLTHLVVSKDNPNKEIQNIYQNEKQYAFLQKKIEIGNQKEQNHIKIFEIDYSKLEE